jgi:hypothetical protein
MVDTIDDNASRQSRRLVMKSLSSCITATAISFAFIVPVHAADDHARNAMDRADAQYKLAKQRCDAMKGQQEDVCEKEAKAVRDKAKADARVSRSNTSGSRADAGETKAKADYRVQKEKCEVLKGREQDACETRAKATLQSREVQADKIRKAD